MNALAISGLEVAFRRRGRPAVRAVAGVDLIVPPVQIVGLVGESGCGKSTLARAAVGLVTPSAGSVKFNGTPVTPLGRRSRPAHLLGLQMVFQNPYASLNPRRRVGAQIADGLSAAGKPAARADQHRVAEVLERVGLTADAAHRFPHEFSGGQRQRIAIARALAARPTTLVLDEPLSSLDASAQAQIASLLVQLRQELSLAILLISHDLSIVRQIADRLAVMYLGRMVESGPTETVWADPQHPYTRALIEAIPRPDGSGRLPSALPGDVPDPGRPPTGCRFHPRCPEVAQRCRGEQPVLVALSPSRSVACWNRQGEET